MDEESTCKPISLVIGINVLIGIVSCFGHGIIAVAVYRHATLRYTPYFFLLNLGVCDITYSFLVMSLTFILVQFGVCSVLPFAQFACRAAFLTSLFTSMCLAGDRVVATRNILSYQILVTKKNTTLRIFGIWMLSFLLNVATLIQVSITSTHGVPKLTSGYWIMIISIGGSSLFIIACLIYCRHVSIADIHRLKKQTRYLHGENAESYFTLKRRMRMSYDITILSMFSVCTLTPVFLIYFKVLVFSSAIDNQLLMINWVIGAIYTAINPFVYMKSMRTLKSYVLKDSRLMRIVLSDGLKTRNWFMAISSKKRNSVAPEFFGMDSTNRTNSTDIS